MALAAVSAPVAAKAAKSIPSAVVTILDKSGLFKIVRHAFEHYCEASLSLQVVIKNESSFELTSPQWYAHHGCHVDPVNNTIPAGGVLEAEFKKARNSFFGLNGYFECAYSQGRKVVVSFSVPWKDKNPNKVRVALCNESKLTAKDIKSMSFGTDMYTKLKDKKLQKKMAAYDVSVVKKACKNPKVMDNMIVVICQMGGSSKTKLLVTIRNN